MQQIEFKKPEFRPILRGLRGVKGDLDFFTIQRILLLYLLYLAHIQKLEVLMCGSLEKLGMETQRDRQRDRDRPGFKGSSKSF